MEYSVWHLQKHARRRPGQTETGLASKETWCGSRQTRLLFSKLTDGYRVGGLDVSGCKVPTNHN